MSDPRLKHNAELTTEFIGRMKVTARYPRISDQVDTLPLQVNKLVRFAYNPSIVAVKGLSKWMWMAYRYHDGSTLATKLGLASIDYNGQVLNNRMLQMDVPEASVEDPKLFYRFDELHISWVQSTWPTPPLTSVVKYGVIDEDKGQVLNVRQIEPTNPKAIEKNHVPILGKYWVYESEPEQIVYELDNGKVVAEHRSPAPSWPYGQIRGGTPPIPYQGKLLRFFHSGLDNEWSGWHRRYFVGAMLMSSEPPFGVDSISSRPILFGSEIDELRVADRSKCLQYKQNVVFPGGCVEHESKFLLALGVNDSGIAIARLTPEQLNL